MIVTWQFTAWDLRKKAVPSRRDRMIPIPGLGTAQNLRIPLIDHIIPSRWDGSHSLHTSLAVNCQATFIYSLRDNRRRLLHRRLSAVPK
jgi:hypothetical protein